MKSFEFITEEEVRPYQYDKVAAKKIAKFFMKHCSESYKMLSFPLWRGMENHNNKAFTADPSTGKRKSQNTTNQYTKLIDSSPYFKGWPKRSRSFICSSSIGKSEGYGTLYSIIPFNGVKIAMCNGKDMWDTIVNCPELGFKGNIDELNDTLDHYNISGKSLLSTIPSENIVSFCKERNIKPNKLLPALHNAMSPQKLKMTLMTPMHYATNKYKNRECWVGGPVLAIRRDIWDGFVAEVKGML